ncbi:uncharacterized protein LOC118736217 [Rhagoletis pomonella]|uniref:uncharacterized protein LOC118736217 n=1 Tax=Rhagoletis pomonella TaxID=28610 RepID=UPI0017814ED9|nr:uncharacterized protein LOC118736217 [Rhagoletis pomonella]
MFTLNDVRTVKKLDLPAQTLVMSEMSNKYKHLKGLPVESYKDVVPQIIIGVNNKHVAMPLKFREGKSHEPAATKTRLGWTVYGTVTDQDHYKNNDLQLHVCECDNNIALDKLVKESMKLENLEPHVVARIHEKTSQQDILEKCVTRTGDHFTTRLLWRSDNIVLPNNFESAMRRLVCFEKKLNKDDDLKNRVNSLINRMEQKQYIRKLSDNEINQDFKRKWYLPIFAVNNPNKPNKTRVVWDAAAEHQGRSLNCCLEKGPDLQRPLIHVLFNFRIGKIGIRGDISEMFHRISVHDEDQHSQRFLWRNCDSSRDPNTYLLQVMSFGATCSPSIAQYVRSRNARENADEFPRAAKSITERHYVDDMLDSVETAEEAVKLIKDVIEVHKRGNFHIRGWLTNSNHVAGALGNAGSSDDFCTAGKTIDQVIEPEKVLRLWWRTSVDVFTFSTRFTKAGKEILGGQKLPTKREIPRLLMSVYDPLGFLSFYTIRLKIVLQNIWRSGIDWDDQIPEEYVNAWQQWLSFFEQVKQVQVPRCYFGKMSNNNCKIELHVFVDASEVANAAVAYFSITREDEVQVAHVSSRTKVAPLRPISIPRMELLAAVLGSRLATEITKGHDFKIHKAYFYTDSRTVLTWLKSDPRKYKQFVMFRVAEIQEHTNVTEWSYIPSKLNVADAATKWKSTTEFSPTSTWFAGPEFLHSPRVKWPKYNYDIDMEHFKDADLNPHVEYIGAHIESQPLIDPTRFSKWERLERCMAYVKRFADKCKDKIRGLTSSEVGSESLTTEELYWSQCHLYRLAQADAYFEEFKLLKGDPGCNLPKHCVLRKLTPFVDENNLIRRCGRLENAPIKDAVKNPIILPKNHKITQLIIEWYHRKYRHVHHETVINEMFQRFYIPSLRRALRTERHNCQYCKLYHAKPVPPKMGLLPEARLSPYTRPYSFVGIDFFGPFLLPLGGVRRNDMEFYLLV